MQLQTPARAPRGFTLVELMIVVAIGTILLAIAVPSYMSYMRQTRRIEAKTAVMDLAAREERYLSTNPTGYTAAAANLGYTALPLVVGSGYYQLSVCTPACAPSALAGALSYTVTATPVAGQGQDQDAQCLAFSVDSAGQQYASGSAGAPYCWAN
jgi:type IV pilus assembly protein PilE